MATAAEVLAFIGHAKISDDKKHKSVLAQAEFDDIPVDNEFHNLAVCATSTIGELVDALKFASNSTLLTFYEVENISGDYITIYLAKHTLDYIEQSANRLLDIAIENMKTTRKTTHTETLGYVDSCVVKAHHDNIDRVIKARGFKSSIYGLYLTISI